MSYRSRTDVFQQYRRSYKSSSSRPESFLSGSPRKDEYTVLNVDDDSEDHWVLWMSNLGRLQRLIHDIEEKLTHLEENMTLDQWPKIEFHIPIGAKSPSQSGFAQACERLKQLISAAQRQIFLLAAGKGSLSDGPECKRLKVNAQKAMTAKLDMVGHRLRACQLANLTQMEKNAEFLSQRVSQAPTKTVESPKPTEEGQQYQQQASLVQHLDIDAQILAEREREIFAIAQSVHDLKSILDHMSQLVLEQGSMIDRIDMNIHDANMHVAQARELVERKFEEQGDMLVRKAVLLGLIGAVIVAFLYIISR